MDIALINCNVQYSTPELTYTNEPQLLAAWVNNDSLTPSDELLGHVLSERRRVLANQVTTQDLRQTLPTAVGDEEATAEERDNAVEALLTYVLTEYQQANTHEQETYEALRQDLTLTDDDIEGGEEYDMTLADLKILAISRWLPDASELAGQTVTITAIYVTADPND